MKKLVSLLTFLPVILCAAPPFDYVGESLKVDTIGGDSVFFESFVNDTLKGDVINFNEYIGVTADTANYVEWDSISYKPKLPKKTLIFRADDFLQRGTSWYWNDSLAPIKTYMAYEVAEFAKHTDTSAVNIMFNIPNWTDSILVRAVFIDPINSGGSQVFNIKVATRVKSYDHIDSWGSWSNIEAITIHNASTGDIDNEFSSTLSDLYDDQNKILSLSDLNLQSNSLCQMQFFRINETINADPDEIYLIQVEIQMF